MIILRYWKSAVWTFVILLATTLPSSSIPKISMLEIPHFDKVVHFALFFVLAIFLLSESNKLRKQGELTRFAAVVALSVSFGFGLTIELLQFFVLTTRSGSLLDFVANMAGALAAVLIYKFVNRITLHWI
ncbi:MAG: VanZ family protein [Bacteroidales bacterium]